MKKKNNIYDINFIKSSQQNRFPLLFIDKIIELKPGKSVTAIKNFTYNEWFFPGHFGASPYTSINKTNNLIKQYFKSLINFWIQCFSHYVRLFFYSVVSYLPPTLVPRHKACALL